MHAGRHSNRPTFSATTTTSAQTHDCVQQPTRGNLAARTHNIHTVRPTPPPAKCRRTETSTKFNSGPAGRQGRKGRPAHSLTHSLTFCSSSASSMCKRSNALLPSSHASPSTRSLTASLAGENARMHLKVVGCVIACVRAASESVGRDTHKSEIHAVVAARPAGRTRPRHHVVFPPAPEPGDKLAPAQPYRCTLAIHTQTLVRDLPVTHARYSRAQVHRCAFVGVRRQQDLNGGVLDSRQCPCSAGRRDRKTKSNRVSTVSRTHTRKCN